MRLRSCNNRARRALRRRVYEEAFAYHTERTVRLILAGRTDKLRESGFVRRHGKRASRLRIGTQAFVVQDLKLTISNPLIKIERKP